MADDPAPEVRREVPVRGRSTAEPGLSGAVMDPAGRQQQLFLEVYGTLPRAGPGGDEHTLRALGLVPGPVPSRVLDLGCGPGAQTLALAAALPAAHIVAVDLLPAMVDEARRRVDAAGVGDRVDVRVGDMASPDVADASQDVIWCEGAIYHLGVTDALRRWRPVLAPGGCVVFTEVVWLVDEPSTDIRRWWESEYPAITDDTGVRARVAAAGFETVTSFVLPASAWRDEYYEPMADRARALRERLPDDPDAGAVAEAAETEIDHHRRFGDQYSYDCFVTRPAG